MHKKVHCVETLESKVEGLQARLAGLMSTSPMEISTPFLVVGSRFAPLPLTESCSSH